VKMILLQATKTLSPVGHAAEVIVASYLLSLNLKVACASYHMKYPEGSFSTSAAAVASSSVSSTLFCMLKRA